MTPIVKPRWPLALVTSLVPAILASTRPVTARSDVPTRAPVQSETVFRHYL